MEALSVILTVLIVINWALSITHFMSDNTKRAIVFQLYAILFLLILLVIAVKEMSI